MNEEIVHGCCENARDCLSAGDGEWIFSEGEDYQTWTIRFCPWCGIELPPVPKCSERPPEPPGCEHLVLVAHGFERPLGFSPNDLFISDLFVICKVCGTYFMNFPEDSWISRIENIPHYPMETCEHPSQFVAVGLGIGQRFCICCGKRWLEFPNPDYMLVVQ